MTNQEIVAKLWNLCNVLRDDGITYHQYVTELTYILFLKMAKETGTEDKIPEKYRWDRLVEKDGLALKKFYEELLRELGENCTGRIQEIYSGARSNIEEPANLKKIITNINDLDWYSAKEEGLGNLYEGLLEKNANEKKSGAGQYFTPRVLIDIMTELIAPQPGERCNDPACGTFGFMIAADAYVKAHTDDLFALDSEQQAFQKNEAFTGAELVHETHRLALMNAMLHDVSDVVTGSTPSKKHAEYYGGDFPFFKPADLEAGDNVVEATEYLSEEGKNVSRIIPKLSTAVCCIGSIGKTGLIRVEGTTNQQINSMIPKINPLYLYYYSKH